MTNLWLWAAEDGVVINVVEVGGTVTGSLTTTLLYNTNALSTCHTHTHTRHKNSP